MNKVLVEYIKIAIEVTLLALFLGAVAIFGVTGKTILNTKTEQNVIMNELESYRKMHSFVNEGLVSGDDLLRFIGLFPRKCVTEIHTPTNDIILLPTDVTTSLWDIDGLKPYLGEYVTKKYKVTGILDDFENRYQRVIFDMVE